jgi:hypothetical protein
LETCRVGVNTAFVVGSDVTGPETGCLLSDGSDVTVLVTGDDANGEGVTEEGTIVANVGAAVIVAVTSPFTGDSVLA